MSPIDDLPPSFSRHVWSLGRDHDVCENCLASLRSDEIKGQVNSPCSGAPMSVREKAIVVAAVERGYAQGVDASSKVMRDHYEELKGSSIGTEVYHLMQQIGDLRGAKRS